MSNDKGGGGQPRKRKKKSAIPLNIGAIVEIPGAIIKKIKPG